MNTNKKVVIVEDDPDLLFLLGKVLMQAGYRVECLRDGTIILNSNFVWPDLFILDKKMESMDGITITKYLKSNKRMQIPIVMMSGTQEFAHKAFQAGVDYFLEKPLNIKKLLKIVDSLTLSPKSGTIS